MSQIYTKLFDEVYFGQPDQNPANPAKWGEGVFAPGLAVRGGFLVLSDDLSLGSKNYIGTALPGNQFVEVKLHRADGNPNEDPWGTDVELVILSDAAQGECYVFYVDSQGDGTADCGIIDYHSEGVDELYDVGIIPFAADDVFRFGAYNGTLYVFQNGNLIATVASGGRHTSGRVGLFMGWGGIGATDPNGIQISEFSGGSITDSVPAFLGSIIESNDAALTAAPFLGTVTVVGSAPAGVLNPYLGKMKVVAPPAGAPNPSLGQVVVITVVPAGQPDTKTGRITES